MEVSDSETRLQKIIHHDSPLSLQKKCKKTGWKLFFFTALHPISYEKTPPNLDLGMVVAVLLLTP